MSCGPCKENAECVEIDEETEEYEALSDLYKRLFEPLADEACDPPDGGHCGCPLTRSAPEEKRTTPGAAAAAAAQSQPDYCADGPADDSRIKRVDRQLTALLQRQRGKDGGGGAGGGGGGGGGAAAAEGDVKHLTANLPAFRSCKPRKPGDVNAALFGLDLEHWMTTATGGDGRDDDVKRAAYDLAAAEAHCKHAGAVEAAEKAVSFEPAKHLAEVAARYGAQTYASASSASQRGGGQESGDDSPVIVVAYVGNTGRDERPDDVDGPKC